MPRRPDQLGGEVQPNGVDQLVQDTIELADAGPEQLIFQSEGALELGLKLSAWEVFCVCDCVCVPTPVLKASLEKIGMCANACP